MSNIFKFVPRNEIGRQVWDGFVDISDEAWLWHKYDLQDAIATWPGKNDESFAVLDESRNGGPVAIVPLHLMKHRWKGIMRMDSLDSLGGPACRNDLGAKHKKKVLHFIRAYLLKLARRFDALDINIAFSPMARAYCGDRCPRVSPLLEIGFENLSTQTWVMDLRKGPEEIWKKMHGRARTAIRKAEKSGVKHRLANQEGDLEIYYQLHCETYERTGVNPHPKSYFDAIWRNFFSKGFARIIFAEYQGEVISAENFGIFKDRAVYWTGCSNDKGLRVGANNLVQWIAMRWMMENKVQWYEVGEAFPHLQSGKLKGLDDFKKSFGGELYPLYKGKIVTRRKKSALIGLMKEFRRGQSQ